MAEQPLQITVLTEDVPGIGRRIAEACPDIVVHPGTKAVDVLAHTGASRVLIGLAQTITQDLVAATPNLQWIQALTTGIDPLPRLRLPERLIVTSARGLHGPQMSEMAFAHMLSLARGLPRMSENQGCGRWERWPQRLLLGKTAVLVGVGSISEELAVRCKAFGMQVIGVSDARDKGRGFDAILPRRQLVAIAADADFLIVLAASTPETYRLISAPV